MERMNRVQFEVVELQSARYVFIFSLPLFSHCPFSVWTAIIQRLMLMTGYSDDGAMRQTRRLQTAINEERRKVDSIMTLEVESSHTFKIGVFGGA